MRNLQIAVRIRAALCACISMLVVVISLASAGPAWAEFGITKFDGSVTNQDGSPDTLAGSHPYAATTTMHFTITPNGGSPTEAPKDIEVALPAGFVGDPNATPQCSNTQFLDTFDAMGCPASSQIGVAKLKIFPGLFGEEVTVPIYNMNPPPGQPAEFGMLLEFQPVFLHARVRNGSDFGVNVGSQDIEQSDLEVFTPTFWGVPADPSHDPERHCTNSVLKGCSSDAPMNAFLTNPTACNGPLTSGLSVDTWQKPGDFATASFVSHDNSAQANPLGIEGCDKLAFEPTIKVAPDTSAADTPAGLTVEVKMPQEGLLNPTGRATPDLKNTTVTLPAGVVINPGQAAGLVACQSGEDGIGTEGPPSCPSASKVGTVEIATPLLNDKLVGNVYVLQSNPPDLKLLVAASADGANLKLVGDVHLDPVTGRLTTTFENTPQLPFNDLKLSFSGGAQAALATPTTCGVYETTSDFTPWSSPQGSDAFPTDSFAVTSGPGGSACTSTLPFTPSMIAGATTDQAGGYTSFSLLLQRGDGQQRISSLQFKTPEGLLGMISKIPLCLEPQASQGTCSAASQIGHTVVQAGPGPYPLEVPEPGQAPAPIYLTGGYKGAPYGLSIAVPVIAGPFNLGTVVVRSSIAVDPHTAQLTVTTDPLPSILDGVPTDLRTVNAVIDRPGFMFNPTGCEPQTFSGTAFSTEGAIAAIASHFQMGSCQSLKFKPDFKVSTAGKTSRAMGASLDAKILYPTGALGNNQASQQSNIASVKVDLPKQLPSRLTTLQKACTAAQFESNPALCPAASLVGHATAVTPVLPVALDGPVYFVSHGGEAFPSLIVVLQGYGVTVDLVGSTFISKAGITSSTFKQIPDVPITSFDLNLPQGKFSALAANVPLKAHGSLCGQKLVMPTAFSAQNGAVIHQTTKISVTGCPKTKAVKAKHKSKKSARKHRKK